MSKFKLTQTATEVQDILNNSLQKPTGLSKTELVGVGVNGQENIEIGDNLTLANGKLSAATGGLPSTVEFDSEGNRTVGKDLGVGGKLRLKGLVSASNPDGYITKELGGPVLHCYSIYPGQSETLYYNVYIPEDFEEFQVDKSNYINITDPKYKPLRKGNYAEMPAVGCYKGSTGTLMICSYVLIETGNNRYTINGYNIETKESYSGMLVHDYAHVIKRY